MAIFIGCCTSAGLAQLPAVADTLVRFIGAMGATKSPATIPRYVSSVATLDRAALLVSRLIPWGSLREVQAWQAAGKVETGFLIRSVGKADAIGGPLDPGDVARIFKQIALAAGIPAQEAARISVHSSRVGAAQDMVRLGVELPAVMQAGGWRGSVRCRASGHALAGDEAIAKSEKCARRIAGGCP